MLPGALAISYNALIIDNDKDYRKTLAAIIKQHFKIREIYTCSTAREALGVCRQLPKIDLVFCDSEITDQPVLSLVDELRKNKSTENTNIVLLSTKSHREFLLEAAAKGVNTFILKPFTTKTVTEKIRKLVSGKTQRKTKRLKLFNTVSAYIAFKDAKYKGEVSDLSSGGCMITLPSLESGGTIYDLSVIRISHDDNTIDIKAELIRLERDTSTEQKKVNAAFIFKEMDEETKTKFKSIWSLLDKSNGSPDDETTDESENESDD